jgi:hypothetical protein
MIASLDTLTAAGQRHMMSKILALFQATVGRHPPGNGSRNQRALSDLVDRLAQEADHLWPDPHQFRQHADSLLRLLTAIT